MLLIIGLLGLGCRKSPVPGTWVTGFNLRQLSQLNQHDSRISKEWITYVMDVFIGIWRKVFVSRRFQYHNNVWKRNLKNSLFANPHFHILHPSLGRLFPILKITVFAHIFPCSLIAFACIHFRHIFHLF